MFIPTKSDGQKLENLRKKTKRIKFKNLSVSSFNSSDHQLLMFVLIFFNFFQVGPICPFLFFFGPFKPRNKLFSSGFNFIYPN